MVWGAVLRLRGLGPGGAVRNPLRLLLHNSDPLQIPVFPEFRPLPGAFEGALASSKASFLKTKACDLSAARHACWWGHTFPRVPCGPTR